MKKNLSMTDYAHLLLKNRVDKKHILIDATMGHGYDTVFLSTLAKHVYAFDVQKMALESTKEKVSTLDNVSLILDSFENVFNYVSTFDGIVFNLGYLPHSDKSITTLAQVTLRTVQMILDRLDCVFILLVVYPGHEEGKKEAQLLAQFISTLKTPVIEIKVSNRKDAPYIYFIDQMR